MDKPSASLSKHRPRESGGRSEQTGWALRDETFRTLRSTQHRRGDGIENERIEGGARHMQARTLARTRLAAVLLAGGAVRGIAGMMCRRRLAAFMFRTSSGICRIRRHLGGHLMMSLRAHVHPHIPVGNRHGMAELADDQTAHQHEDQGPALPEKLTHGRRVQSDAASRNYAPDRSFEIRGSRHSTPSLTARRTALKAATAAAPAHADRCYLAGTYLGAPR